MKQFNLCIVKLCFFIFLTLVLQSCSVWIPGGMVDSTGPIPQKGYQVLGEAVGEETSTTFLIFQFNKPNKDFIERATEKAIKKRGGDELINVTWYHKYTDYFLFHTYSFVVKGIVVKRVEVPSSSAPISTAVSAPQASSAPALPENPPQSGSWINLSQYFQSIEFSLSRGWGTYTVRYFNGKKAYGGFGGFVIQVSRKDVDKFYYFYPQISHAKLSRADDEKKLRGMFIRFIPLTVNVGFNLRMLDVVAANLPYNLNPVVNAGLGYYLTQLGYNNWGYSDWEWDHFGWRFGWGVEYPFRPGLWFKAGFEKNNVITGDGYSFWTLNLGIIFQRKSK